MNRVLLESLLRGDFICEVTQPHHFALLRDANKRQEINQYLRLLNRRLATNPQGSVWYLAWVETSSDVRGELSRQLKETIDSLVPMLELLMLVQETLGSDTVLSAQDILNRRNIADCIENNISLREQLNQLCATRLFASQSQEVDGQLKQVFDRLCQTGYLIQPHKDRLIYRVTGKIDYLLDLTRFIQEEENIKPIEAPQNTQPELLG